MKTRFYQIMTICALLLAAAALAVALWSSAVAQEEAPQEVLAIPTTINYQGLLRQPDGSLTDGTYEITAKIYDQATGGNLKYETTLPGVTVRDGLFNIVLGDNPPMPSSVLASAPRYIGISLNGGAELIPRQRLHAVPWAFQAQTLVNNAPAQTIQGLTSNGDVTVNGITTANQDLNVAGALNVGGLITSQLTDSLDPDNVVTTKDYVDTKWPDGNYCILMAGGSCPAGFATGGIYVDGEDSDPQTSCYGNIGNSSCTNAGASFAFCCK